MNDVCSVQFLRDGVSVQTLLVIDASYCSVFLYLIHYGLVAQDQLGSKKDSSCRTY